ncbi:DNA cytosine methyltransferase [Acidobacteriota bacterium]
MAKRPSSKSQLKTASLFAGIGGLDLGLHRAGHRLRVLCEIDEAANAVLTERFSNTTRFGDIRALDCLPAEIELVTGGFPCQDLSQAGETKGIHGKESGLVKHIFRILRKRSVPWVLLENVPFMLQLRRGAAMRYILDELEELGYQWAYRVIDTRAFGLPQRRERVFLLASLVSDPAGHLLVDDAGAPKNKYGYEGRACGFYWTEGNRGLGWAVNALPTLKGGSGLGIPSPPAIWMPDGQFVTPDIRDAERLQGFEPDWTLPASQVNSDRYRWKLVGNAVSVPVAEWLGKCIRRQSRQLQSSPIPMMENGRLPKAAFGSRRDGRHAVSVSSWPMFTPAPHLKEFLMYAARPLSARAVRGFKTRLEKSSLKSPDSFKRDLTLYLDRALKNEKSKARRTKVSR